MSEHRSLIAHIAARSVTLSERLSAAWQPSTPVADPNVAAQYLEIWRRNMADDDPDLFVRRLAQDGHDLDSISSRLGEGRWQGDRQPSWTDMLVKTLHSSSAAEDRVPDAPTLLSAALRPLIVAADGWLRWPTEVMDPFVASSAYTDLLLDLWRRLAEIAGPTLAYEFQRFRYEQRGMLARLLAEEAAEYAAFAAFLSGSGWENFLREYAVLSRLLATVAADWVTATTAFFTRLIQDLPVLAGWHGVPTLGVVSSARSYLSDPHHSGQTATAVTFSGGVRIIYKPRSLSADALWYNVLNWCNQRNTPLPFQIVPLLDRGEYGWMAWIEPAPVHDAAAAQRFYRRAGMLLCLFYLLDGGDGHAENWIAAGEQPVLVDAEMLLTPRLHGNVEADVATVLRTGMLPRWERQPEGGILDLSFLSVSNRHFDSRPLLDGRTLNAADYVDEIIDGFRQMAAFLADHAVDLLSARGPLAVLEPLLVRFNVRPTAIYTHLLDQLRHPSLLRDGVVFGVHLDQLSRTYLISSHAQSLWPLLRQEVAALSRLDIPRFTASASDTSLVLAAVGSVADSVARTPLAQCMDNFAHFTAEDVDVQCGLIHAVLSELPAPTVRRSGHPASFAAMAVLIGERLAASAIPLPDESLSWARPVYNDALSLYQHDLLSDDLFGGRSGVALFFAALASVTGQERWRELSLSALPVHPHCDDLGAATGLGSLLYTYTLISRLLKEPALIDTAAHLAHSLSTQRIDAEQNHSLGGGVAGAIVGLLSLYSVCPQADLLAKAVHCGDHLLKNRVAARDGYSWRTSSGLMPGGLTNGTAGIAFALLKLYAAHGDERWLLAAQGALFYERSLFSSLTRRSSGSQPGLDRGWSHGAVGVGLARLATLPILGGQDVRNEILAAVDAVTHEDMSSLHYYAAGTLGEVELLFETGLRLNRREMLDAAYHCSSHVLAHVEKVGSFFLSPELPRELFHPSFFLGEAGIGYALLRLAQYRTEGKTSLPSVLSWEV
jgi:lantibiotic modifying enzyme